MQANIDLIESTAADFIHFDIMDGNFVPVITYGPKMVSDCRKRAHLPFDVHLMVDKPERFVADFAKAGADYITIQAEATTHLHRVLTKIRELGCRPGLAVFSYASQLLTFPADCRDVKPGGGTLPHNARAAGRDCRAAAAIERSAHCEPRAGDLRRGRDRRPLAIGSRAHTLRRRSFSRWN